MGQPISNWIQMFPSWRDEHKRITDNWFNCPSVGVIAGAWHLNIILHILRAIALFLHLQTAPGKVCMKNQWGPNASSGRAYDNMGWSSHTGENYSQRVFAVIISIYLSIYHLYTYLSIHLSSISLSISIAYLSRYYLYCGIFETSTTTEIQKVL
jgi:hypothetical protein